MQIDTAVCDYWSSYYGNRVAPVLPSQFALFVANEVGTGELPPIGTIIDVGCGNGRDALFFLGLGYRVYGIDRSVVAIEACRELLDGYGKEVRSRGDFAEAAADAPSLWRDLANGASGPVLVYARFFFHAIDEQAQASVLCEVADLLARRGGAFCAEFRTLEDSACAKATPDHYRRFIDPDAFASCVEEAGMHVVWQAEGRGMAKYRQDDAHVARVIALGAKPAAAAAEA
jgi:SAM-dependent methyltransferase